jgi:hypothetical protein
MIRAIQKALTQGSIHGSEYMAVSQSEQKGIVDFKLNIGYSRNRVYALTKFKLQKTLQAVKTMRREERR